MFNLELAVFFFSPFAKYANLECCIFSLYQKNVHINYPSPTLETKKVFVNCLLHIFSSGWRLF